MRARSTGLMVLVLAAGARTAGADEPRPAPPPETPPDQPAEAGSQPAADPPAPGAVPAQTPCGDPEPADSKVVVVCSTWRASPSQAGELLREHMGRRPRSGGAIGAGVMTTITPRMRRDAVEVQLGAVRDRRGMLRFLVRPVRGVLDGGEIDHGLELGLGAALLVGRFHVGIEGNVVFGVAFPNGKFASGLAAVVGFELLATDRLALVATARLGFDTFEQTLPNGTVEDTGDPLASIALGVNFFQVVPR